MAKKEKQLPLIDVGPNNLKEIMPHIEAYRNALQERLAYGKEEVKHKVAILELVKESGLKPLPDGSIQFTCDGYKVTITPRDQLVSVKEEDPE